MSPTFPSSFFPFLLLLSPSLMTFCHPQLLDSFFSPTAQLHPSWILITFGCAFVSWNLCFFRAFSLFWLHFDVMTLYHVRVVCALLHCCCVFTVQKVQPRGNSTVNWTPENRNNKLFFLYKYYATLFSYERLKTFSCSNIIAKCWRHGAVF